MLLKLIQSCIAVTIISLYAILLCPSLKFHIGLMPIEIIDKIIPNVLHNYAPSRVIESERILEISKVPDINVLNNHIKKEILLTNEQINDLKLLSYCNAYNGLNNLSNLILNDCSGSIAYKINTEKIIKYVDVKQTEYPSSNNVIPFAKHTLVYFTK